LKTSLSRRFSPTVVLASLLIMLAALSACGPKQEEGAQRRIHVTQFRMPFGQSRLLTYSFPSLELVSEHQLGGISVRMVSRPRSSEIWIGSELSKDVVIYDAQADSVLGRISLGVPVGGLAFDKMGNSCLVTHGAVIVTKDSAANATLLNAVTRTPMKAFRVGKSPRDVCWDSRSLRAFVANTGDSTLSLLNMGMGFTSDSMVVGAAPHDVTVDPDQRWLYVACLGAPTPEGRETGEVQVYSLPELELLTSFASGEHPSRVTCGPRGDFIVVSELMVGERDNPRVRTFDVTLDAEGRPGFTLRDEIDAGVNPLSGGMSLDAEYFLAPDFAACRVSVIDLNKGNRLRWLQLPGEANEYFAVDAVFSGGLETAESAE